jgi:hypothetical protein
MGNPLDDALHQVDLAQQHRLQQQAAAQHSVEERGRRLQALVDDFLKRMHTAGDPGTDFEMRDGIFRKVRGWTFHYIAGESRLALVLRVDGLVPHADYRSVRYVRPADSGLNLNEETLKKIAFSMAEVLRQYGVQ